MVAGLSSGQGVRFGRGLVRSGVAIGPNLSNTIEREPGTSAELCTVSANVATLLNTPKILRG